MARRFVFSGLVFGAIALMAAPAWAHVSVSPSSAPAGGFATLTFQVPNETDDATTTKLEVQFPQDHPIADASVQALAGWKIEVTKKKLTTPVTTDEGDTLDEAVNTITWTASAGQGIPPGFFEQFLVSVGLPGEGDTLAFPAVQTYSNGDVVRWIERAAEGGPEPENPAPTLTLTAGGDDHGGTATTTPAGSAAAESNGDKTNDDGKTLAIVALVVGGVALLAALTAIAGSRARRTSN